MSHGRRRDAKLEARWRKVLAWQRRSGVTVRVFCEREGVKESTFHFWKRELARRDRELVGRQRSAAGHGRARRMTMPALVPVTIGPAIRPPIELQLSSGTSVRVAAGCEEALLRMVLSILERA